MARYYNGQSSLRITLTTGVDITGATCIIKYIKPSGETGHFDATIQTALTGVIYYDCAELDIDEAGEWTFWAFVTFTDGRDAPGKAFKIYFYEEGE